MPQTIIKGVVTDFGLVHARFNKMKACEQYARHSSLSAGEIYKVLVGSRFEKQLESGEITGEQFAEEVIKAINAQTLSVNECLAIWGDIFTENPGFLELVQDLKRRRLRTALLSNTNAVHWPYIQKIPSVALMERSGDPLILSHLVRAMKPDAKIYRAALDALWCKPEEAVYIDDIAAYVDTAVQLGMKGVVYDCTKQSTDVLRKNLEQLGVL